MQRFLFLSILLSIATFSLAAQEVPTQPDAERQEMRSPKSRKASPHAHPGQGDQGHTEGRRPDAKQRAARLAQFLELDEKQTITLTDFLTSSASAMRNELAATETPEARKAIREEYKQMSDQKIAAILRPDQLERYEQMKAKRAVAQANRSEKMQQRRQEGQAKPRKEMPAESGKSNRGQGGKY